MTTRRIVENKLVNRLVITRFPPAPEGIDPETHQRLVTAIREKRLIRFSLDGKTRVAEPHDYGIRNGAVRLLVYQLSGASSGRLPGWRWIDVSRVIESEALGTAFPGSRTVTGRHQTWDVLFARVSPS